MDATKCRRKLKAENWGKRRLASTQLISQLQARRVVDVLEVWMFLGIEIKHKTTISNKISRPTFGKKKSLLKCQYWCSTKNLGKSCNCQYNCFCCKIQKKGYFLMLLCILQQTSSFDCQHFRAQPPDALFMTLKGFKAAKDMKGHTVGKIPIFQTWKKFSFERDLNSGPLGY